MAKVKGRKFGNTDFGEIADQRINSELDWTKISNEDDYKRAVRDLLKNKPQDRDGGGSNRAINLLPYIDDLFRESDASERIAKNKMQKIKEEEDAFRDALRFERRRKLRERLRDESRTAKNTRPASRSSVRVWKRHPTMSDIRGVDTRIRSRGLKTMITKAKEQELRSKNIAVVYDARRIRHLRDIKTGRFTRMK